MTQSNYTVATLARNTAEFLRGYVASTGAVCSAVRIHTLMKSKDSGSKLVTKSYTDETSSYVAKATVFARKYKYCKIRRWHYKLKFVTIILTMHNKTST